MTLKEYLNTPKIKPVTFITVILGILYYMFMNTTFFDNLNQDWKTLIYIGIIVIAAMTGVSILSVKAISDELNSIIQDVKLSPEQQIGKLTLLAVKVNTQLGRAWELYNMTSEAQSTPETADNPKELESMTEQIKKLEEEIRNLTDGT